METVRYSSAEFPPHGRKALGIILEDQKRVARRRGTSGIYSGDRPLIQLGSTLTAIILARFSDEMVSDVPVQINRGEQVIFDSGLMEKLFAEVKPGKPARAEGTGRYHYGSRIYLKRSKGDSGELEDEVDYDTPVDLSLKMRLSRDAKKVVIKIRAKKAGTNAGTEPIVKNRLVFRAFMTPDFKGILDERLRMSR